MVIVAVGDAIGVDGGLASWIEHAGWYASSAIQMQLLLPVCWGMESYFPRHVYQHAECFVVCEK